MKNIHVIPTDKPTRVYENFADKLSFTDVVCDKKGFNTNQNIYITSDELIKKDDYWLNIDNSTIHSGWLYFSANKAPSCKKIILTTNDDLIKDGVQCIDEKFLQWFVDKANDSGIPIDFVEVVAELKAFDKNGMCVNFAMYDDDYTKNVYYIVPQEGFEHPRVLSENGKELFFDKEGNIKQETLEEFIDKVGTPTDFDQFTFDEGIKVGAKWQHERMYSEEEIHNIIKSFRNGGKRLVLKVFYDKWFEQFKKK